MNPDITRLYVRLINLSPRCTEMDITFDELRTLYETDPAQAEIKSKEIIDEYIATLPPERQLRAQAFNWRIQQELRNLKDPVARMNRMVEMFWKGVQEFETVLNNPNQVLKQTGELSDVVQFPKKT